MSQSSKTIEPAELANLCEGDAAVDLIDVRTPAEFRTVHVSTARNIPLDRLDPKAVMADRDGNDTPLYVICKAGGRGDKACRLFAEAGFPDVINVTGGTDACEAAGVPLTRGIATMSLERQVRIAAGSLVLLGVILAATVDHRFIGISAFVGAGLIFAGITDTCGMGMMLAKMPWNRR